MVGDGGVGESATRGKLTPPGMRCSIGAVGDGSSRGILMTPCTAHDYTEWSKKWYPCFNFAITSVRCTDFNNFFTGIEQEIYDT